MKRKFPVGLVIAELVFLGLEALILRYVMEKYNIALGFDRFASVVFVIVVMIAFDCLVAVCVLIKSDRPHYKRRRWLAGLILTLALSCAATVILWAASPAKIAAMQEDMASDAAIKDRKQEFSAFVKELRNSTELTEAAEDETPVVTGPFYIVCSTVAGTLSETGGKEQFFGSAAETYGENMLPYGEIQDSKTVIFVYTQGKEHVTNRGYWAYSNGQKAEDAYVYDVYVQVYNIERGIKYAPIWFSEVLANKTGDCYYDSQQYQTGDFLAVYRDFIIE